MHMKPPRHGSAHDTCTDQTLMCSHVFAGPRDCILQLLPIRVPGGRQKYCIVCGRFAAGPFRELSSAVRKIRRYQKPPSSVLQDAPWCAQPPPESEHRRRRQRRTQCLQSRCGGHQHGNSCDSSSPGQSRRGSLGCQGKCGSRNVSAASCPRPLRCSVRIWSFLGHAGLMSGFHTARPVSSNNWNGRIVQKAPSTARPVRDRDNEIVVGTVVSNFVGQCGFHGRDSWHVPGIPMRSTCRR